MVQELNMCDNNIDSVKDSRETCFICEQPVLSEKVNPGAAAVQTVKECSKKRGDGKHKLLSENSQIVVHRSCRNIYTKSFYVEQAKRIRTENANEMNSPKRLRSKGGFNFEGFCLFCSAKVDALEKKSLDKVRQILSKDFQQKIKQQALSRKDKWG